jgi:hypothetical protein
MLTYLNAIMAYTPTVCIFNDLQPTKSIYMEPVRGLNLNRRSISGPEPEMPLTVDVRFSVAHDHSDAHTNSHIHIYTRACTHTHIYIYIYTHARARTNTHTRTNGRTALDKGSAPRTGLFLCSTHTHETDIHDPARI